MKLGIVGLPNVGKSTLFNALTGAGVPAANYPFCTIDPSVGVVAVPDPRLDFLAAMYSPEKYTPATVEFVDIAGLVKGASKGEGLGNQFLSHIREVDAVLEVVRCFENDDIIHVDGGVNPVRDVETIRLELILSDAETVKRRLDKAKKLSKGDRAMEKEAATLARLLAFLEEGRPAAAFPCDEEEEPLLRELCRESLLSGKPVIYAANVGEEDLANDAADNPHVQALTAFAQKEGSLVLPVCAAVEEELSGIEDDAERREFQEALGVTEPGLNRLIRESYRLLGLISFLTAGPKEVRAWTISKGTKAPEAAGKIHSDFERGFIRAEVVAFDDLAACGDMNKVRAKGLLRSEGKDYVMRDGDIVVFRFNV